MLFDNPSGRPNDYTVGGRIVDHRRPGPYYRPSADGALWNSSQTDPAQGALLYKDISGC